MSAKMSGMVVSEVRELAKKLDSNSERLDRIRIEIGASFARTSWEGSDRQKFIGHFQSQIAPQLKRVAISLRTAAKTARQQADQQEVTSDVHEGGILGNISIDLPDLPGFINDRLGGPNHAIHEASDWLADQVDDIWDWGHGVVSDIRNLPVVDEYINLVDHQRGLFETLFGNDDSVIPDVRVTEVMAAALGVLGAEISLSAAVVSTAFGFPENEMNLFDDGVAHANPAKEIPIGKNPQEIADYMELVSEAHASDSVVNIVKRVGPDGQEHYVVLLPGTETWNPFAGKNPKDVTGNILTASGNNSAFTNAVMEAIRENIPPDAPVMLVGHSQGGMTAVDLAKDPTLQRDYNLEYVVTYGSPVENTRVPENTTVVNIAHEDDLVPQLDLNGLTVGTGMRPENGPNVTNITLPNPWDIYQIPEIGPLAPLGAIDDMALITNHSHEEYSHSVRNSDNRSLQKLERDPSFQTYFSQGGSEFNRFEVELVREDR